MKTPEELVDSYVELEFKGHGGLMARAVCRHDFMSGYQAARQEWISVADSLPQDHGSYLVTRCCVVCGVPTLDNQVLRFLGFWDTDLPNAVTHWMPLPPLPKA